MKNNKGFALIAGVLIIIVVLAVGGIVYYAGKNSNTLPKNDIGTWIHAQEEDTGNNLVYKNSETYTPSPTRFRHYFTFKGNNICNSLQLAADDAHYLKDVNCSLTTDGGITFLNLDKEKYNVINQSEFRLVLQKIDIAPQVIDDKGEKYCSKDSDCACGVNIETKNCFLGNKKYVDTTKQCPDFCGGIAGNLTTKCIDNSCKQVSNTQDNNLRQEGETCGENIGNCQAGFKCAYPCGIPGCQNICLPENEPPRP